MTYFLAYKIFFEFIFFTIFQRICQSLDINKFSKLLNKKKFKDSDIFIVTGFKGNLIKNKTKNPQIRALAKSIIETQEKEIVWMKNFAKNE